MNKTTNSILKKPAFLIFIGIFITLSTTAITAISLYQMRQDALTQARNGADNLVRSLQKEIEQNLDLYQLAMHDAVSNTGSPGIHDVSPAARTLVMPNAFGNVKDSGVIVTTDAAGNILSDSHIPLPPGYKISKADYFSAQMRRATAGTYVSKPFLLDLDGAQRPVVALSLRLNDAQDHFAGIAASIIRLDYFRQLFEGSILGKQGSLTLIRTDGTVLMRRPYQASDLGSTLAGAHSFEPLVHADHGAYIDVAVLDHIERLYSFRRIGRYPLTVIVGLATDDIYATWRQRARDIGIVTATFDIFIIALALMYSRQLRSRLVMEQQLKTLAWFDALTGLPNRERLSETISNLLPAAGHEGTRFAVLSIGLDRFKRINDTQGHDVGDEALVEIARRLRKSINDQDVLGRLGSDEFLVIVQDCDAQAAAQRAARILHALSESLEVGSSYRIQITPSASVGIALYPDDGLETNILLRSADMAMFKAKSDGRNQVHFYTPAYEQEAKAQLELEMALQRAIQERELDLVYQPKIDTDGCLRGAEALLRWKDEKLGVISPDRFIAIAEESRLIAELDTWVLDEACRQLMVWRANGMEIPNISVNVCVADFKQRDYSKFVMQTLQAHGLKPADLTLEMTERIMFDESADDVRASLRAIHALGIVLSIDDFGTGYSSLSYLHRLPVQELKIDRSFVQGIGKDPTAELLTQTIVSIGRVLELSVVAEGVETPEQRNFLEKIGCLTHQGYLYSPPLSAHEFVRWVASRERHQQPSA